MSIKALSKKECGSTVSQEAVVVSYSISKKALFGVFIGLFFLSFLFIATLNSEATFTDGVSAASAIDITPESVAPVAKNVGILNITITNGNTTAYYNLTRINVSLDNSLISDIDAVLLYNDTGGQGFDSGTDEFVAVNESLTGAWANFTGLNIKILPAKSIYIYVVFNVSVAAVDGHFLDAYIPAYNITLLNGTKNETGNITDLNPSGKVIVDAASPIADAGLDASVNEGANYTFDGRGSTDTVNVTNWTWDFGDGAIGYGNITNHTYYSAGTYVVTLNVTDGVGNWDVDTVSVVVQNMKPIADFTHNAPKPEGQNVTFDATSSGEPGDNITWYEWDWNGDGIFDLGTSVAIVNQVFYAPGSYNVTLRVTDEENTVNLKNNTVVINDVGPTACYTNSSAPHQEGVAASFDASCSYEYGDNIAYYNWTFFDNGSVSWSNGTSSTIQYAWSSTGNYNVTLEVKDEDGNTSIYNNTFTVDNVNPIACFISDSPKAEGSAVSFDASCSFEPGNDIKWYNWTFQNNGTTDYFNSTTPTASYIWYSPGTYTVTLNVTDKDSTSNSTSSAVTITNVAPTASFTSTSPKSEGIEIDFDASGSSEPGENIKWYNWTFHNSTQTGYYNDTAPFSNFIWYTPGTFQVDLRVVDNDTTVNTYTWSVVVNNVPPTGSFSHDDPKDEGKKIYFNATAVEPGNDTSYFEWDWDGDGLFDLYTTNPRATHTYGSPGSYNVTLKVVDDDNTVGFTNATIVINDVGPTACYTNSSAPHQEGDSISFDGSCSYEPGDNIAYYNWTFFDSGSTSWINGTDQTVQYIWNSPGIYNVTLEVKDEDGNTSIQNNTFTAGNVVPTACFTSDAPKPEGSAVSFDAFCSFEPGNDIKWHNWTFEDNGSVFYNNGTNITLSNIWSSPGSWNVTLNVTDEDGSYSNTSIEITVTNVAPTAFFTSTSPKLEGTKIDFDASGSLEPGDDIKWYNWTFHNSTQTGYYNDTAPYANFTWYMPGAFQVDLRVVDNDTSIGTYTWSVVVNNVPPTGSFSHDDPKDEGKKVYFNATAVEPGNDISYFEWDWDGDGLFDLYTTNPRVTHTYSSPGSYNVTLKVVDNDNTVGFANATIIINDIGPIACYTNSSAPYEEGMAVSFDASCSFEPGDDNVYYNWTFFDNGSTSWVNGTDPTVQHIWSSPGTYNVTLEVKDEDGNTSIQNKTFTIGNVVPTACFTSDGPKAEGSTVSFDASCSFEPGSNIKWYNWTFQDNGTTGYFNSTSLTASYIWYSPGTFTVMLSITDEDSGLDSISISTTITNVAPVASFTTGSPKPEGIPMSFDGSGSTEPGGNISSYNWTFYNGTQRSYYNSTSPTANFTWYMPGVFQVNLTVYDDDGSSGSTYIAVIVTNVLPTGNFNHDGPKNEGMKIYFNASSVEPGGNIAWYEWDWNGDGMFDYLTVSNSTTHTWYTAGCYNVVLKVMDDDSSMGLVNRTVCVIDVEPAADFTYMPSNPEEGQEVSFVDNSTEPGSNIVWYNWTIEDDGFMSWVNGSSSMEHIWNRPGNYDVTLNVTDSEGSSDTATKSITVGNAKPTACFTSNTPKHEGSAVSFDASCSFEPGNDFLWYNWTFNDNGSVSYNNGTNVTLSYIWHSPGTWDVALNVTDEDGSYHNITNIISVLDVAPIASFVSSSPKPEGTVMSFDASASIEPGGNILRYNWTFYNGTQKVYNESTTPTASFTWYMPGVFQVNLTVYDEDGSSGSTYTAVVITNVAPIGSFTHDDPKDEGMKVYFNATAVEPGNDISYFEWDWDGDGLFDLYTTNPRVTHTYSSPDSYNVTLKVVDDDNTIGLTNATVVINDVGPAACYTNSSAPYEEGMAVSFDASCSFEPGDDNVYYNWTFFDNGSTSWVNGTDPTVQYLWYSPGTYNVTLEVKDEDGNTSIQNKTFIVGNVVPIACFTSDAPKPEGSAVSFDASCSFEPGNDIKWHNWTFEDNGSVFYNNGTNITLSNIWSSPGSWNVTLNVTDEDGSYSNLSMKITITNIAPTATFTSTSPKSEGVRIDFDASGSSEPGNNIKWYNWTFHNSTQTGYYNDTAPYADFTWYMPGVFQVDLRIVDNDTTVGTYTWAVVVNNVFPTGSFSHDDPKDEGKKVYFNATALEPGNDISYFEWDWDGDGLFDLYTTNPRVTHTYSSPGSYNVTLKVVDDDNTVGLKNATIVISDAGPTACYANSSAPHQEGVAVSFDASCSYEYGDNIAYYNWTFEDNGSVTYINGTDSTVNYMWYSPGTYSVILNVTDEDNSWDNFTKIIAISNVVPVAAFTNNTPKNEGDIVTFDASGSYEPGDDITQYLWDFDGDGFDDGIGSIITNTWLKPGIYPVSLKVIDADGTSNETSETVIIVNVKPSVDYTYSPEGLLYEGDNVTFNASLSTEPGMNITSYNWTIYTYSGPVNKSGKTTYQVWTRPGFYKVTLKVTDEDGAIGYINYTIVINNVKPTSDFTHNSTAGSPKPEKEVVTFDASAIEPGQDILYFEWDWDGDGVFDYFTTQNITTHIWDRPGFYNVVLRAVDEDNTVGITNSTVVISNVGPTANFTFSPKPPAEGQTVIFTDNSSEPGDDIIWYNWIFENNGTIDYINGTNPTVSYTWYSPGAYNVTLKVTDEDNSWNSTTNSITITNVEPIAAFTNNTPKNEGDTVTFDASGSYEPGDDITQYLWDFDGDGFDDGTEPIVTNTWLRPGSYTVYLRVIDADGTLNDTFRIITILNVKPTVDYTYDPSGFIYEGDDVSFNASISTEPGMNITSYNWTFYTDSGSVEKSGITTDFNWTKPGAYKVTLKVTDEDNSIGYMNGTITVNNVKPTANFTHSAPQPEGIVVTFDASSSFEPGMDIVWYEWDWNGDGLFDYVSILNTTTHVWDRPGFYNVVLRAVDEDNTVGITNRTVVISNVGPTANFTFSPESPAEGQTVIFTDNSSEPGDDIVWYNWTFEDNGTIVYINGTNPTASYTWYSPGIYNVSQNVTDEDGSWDNITKIITITNVEPVAAFMNNTPKNEGDTVTFDASGSYEPGGDITQYLWDFDGDGFDDGTGLTITNTWLRPGIYIVSLRVIDADGTLNDASQSITILNVKPIADYTYDPSGFIYEGDDVSFNASISTEPSMNITSYNWTFYTDSGSVEKSGITADFNWTRPGTYKVTLKITDEDNTLGYINRSIAINNVKPTADFTHDAPKPEGTIVTFDASDSSEPGMDIILYEWDWDGDGVYELGTTLSIVTHTWFENGTYNVTLRVTDEDDSTNRITYIVIIADVGPTAIYVHSALASEGETVTFNAINSTEPGNDIVAYEWDLDNDGVFDDASGIVITYTWYRNDTYPIGLRVTDEEGNTSVLYQNIIIEDVLPTPDFTHNAPQPEGGVVSFDATSSFEPGGDITFYNWTLEENGTTVYINGANPITSYIWYSPGTYRVTLNVTDEDGSWQNLTKNIVITNAPPIASFTNDAPKAEGQLIEFNATTSNEPGMNITTYEWDLDNDAIFNDDFGAVITYSWSKPGTYRVKLKVTDSDSSSSVTYHDITILNVKPTACFTHDAPKLEGDVVTFDASCSTEPGMDITWYEWDWDGDGVYDFGTASPVVIHIWNESGGYHVTLRVTDEDDTTNKTTLFDIISQNTNDPPIITSSPITFATEDSPYAYNVFAMDEDMLSPGGDTLTWSLDVFPPEMVINPSNGLITWTPTNLQAAQVWPVTVRVTDTEDDFDTQAFNIVVSNTNDAPMIHSILNQIAMEETEFTYDVDATDEDLLNPSGERLVFFLDSKPDGMNIDSSTGLITWTPANGQDDTHTVTVRVTDGETSDTETFQITSQNTNDPPRITSMPVILATEEEMYTYTVAVSDDDLSTIAGDVITYSLDSAPYFLSMDSNAGVVSGIPSNENASRSYTVIVNATDSVGVHITQTYVLSVVNINDLPVISHILDQTVDEDTEFNYFVEANDDDLLNPSGEMLIFTLDQKPSGMTIDSTTGQIRWVPTDNQLGNHTVTVGVSDGDVSITETFEIVVRNVNDPPTILGIIPAIVFEEDAQGEIDLTEYKFDRDNSVSDLMWTVRGYNESFINITVEGNTLIITPVTNKFGKETITLILSDGLETDEQNVNVEIRPINDLPIAQIEISNNNVEAGTNLDFTAVGSSDVEGAIIEYLWDLGDGTFIEGQEISHTYESAGSFVVQLTITDSENSTSTSKTVVHIKEKTFPQIGYIGLILAILGLVLAIMRIIKKPRVPGFEPEHARVSSEPVEPIQTEEMTEVHQWDGDDDSL